MRADVAGVCPSAEKHAPYGLRSAPTCQNQTHQPWTSATAFLRMLSGANKCASTITASSWTDLLQFTRFLAETICTIASLADITRTEVSEFLGHFADRHLSGVTRASWLPFGTGSAIWRTKAASPRT